MNDNAVLEMAKLLGTDQNRRFKKSISKRIWRIIPHCSVDDLVRFVNAELNLSGNKILHARDLSGNTPLIIAASHGRTEVCKYLIDTAGVDIQHQNKYGMSAIHWAAREGKLETCQLLLERGIDYQKPAQNGSTPVSLSFFSRHGPCFAELMLHGAELPSAVVQDLHARSVVESTVFKIRVSMEPSAWMDEIRKMCNDFWPEHFFW